MGPGPDDRARRDAQRHRTDPAEPNARRHRQRGRLRTPVGRAQRRREEVVRPDGRGLRRLLGIHRRPGRQDRRLPGADRSVGQHADLLLRRQRRLRRGIAQRFGEREQVLQRLSRRTEREHAVSRHVGQPGNLQPLPDRLGGGVLHTVPDVQALRPVLRRHLRPAGDPLAQGHQGQGRNAPPVPPLHRHRPDHPGRHRSGDAEGVPGRGAVPPQRGVNALQLRRRRRSHHKETSVLRHARYPRPVAGRLEGLGSARPDQR